MSTKSDGPEQPFLWTPVPRSRDLFIKHSDEDIAAFGQRLSEHRCGMRLISSELKELLADIFVSQYFENELFQCRSRLSEFIRIVKHLKDRVPPDLDVELLLQFKAAIDDYLNLLSESRGPFTADQPYWEELFDDCLGKLRTSLPLIADWEATQTVHSSQAEDSGSATRAVKGASEVERLLIQDMSLDEQVDQTTTSSEQHPLDSEANPVAMPRQGALPLGGFADASDPVPAKFREQRKDDGRELGPMVGTASTLLWQLSEHWSSKSKDLLTKHKMGIVFVRQLGVRRYEMFFSDAGALRRAQERGKRPKKRPTKP
jgi:hypothetical protein